MAFRYSFNLTIQLILFIIIVNQELNNLEFNGIYRIDSLLNNYCLVDENYSLQFADKKVKNGQLYRIKKNEKNVYVIESKKGHIKLGVNQNGHVLMAYRPSDFKDKMEWNIFQIEENQYVIQNNGNQKFMEINQNFFQCMNDLPTPIEEHKSEINKNFRFNFFKLFEEVNIKPDHEEIINKEPIDVVIKYIDLTDKTLKREGITQIQKDEDNEELRYSVRSILQYIPWVRKIFILMPNEKVKYFKPYDEIKEKIVYIKDKDVLGYDSANIYAFTFNLFRLEKFGLSNNFIYMDDDFFFGKNLNKSNFFYYEENEKRVVPSLLNVGFSELFKERKISEYKMIFSKKDSIHPQSFMAWILSLLSTEKFFIDYYSKINLINPTPSHNAISYNIQDLKEIYDLVKNNYQYANETLNSIHRHILTLQTQHFVDLYTLNIKHRKVHSINYNVIPIDQVNLAYMSIELFAINQGGDKTYSEEELKHAKEVMYNRFSNPTPYEIPDNNMKLMDKPNIINQGIKGKEIIAISSKDNSGFNPIEEDRNNIIDLQGNDAQFIVLENKALAEINKKQSLIIKISNILIILMTLLILTLFYLYCNEKNKNKYRYSRMNEYEYRRRVETID